MTHRIFLCEDRVPFLLNEMIKDKVKILETDPDGMTEVEIIIEDSFDVLRIFHAGVEAGAESFKKPRLV